MKWAVNKKMHFEVAAIRAIQILQSATLTEVLDTLTALRGGQPLPAVTAPTKPAAPRAEPRAPAAHAAPPTPTAPPPAKPPVSQPRAVETSKVAEPPPEPAPAAPVSNEAFWKTLVETVRRDRKLITAWLEAGALIRIEGAVVQIGFPPDQAFSKDFLEQGHRDFLASTASAILGRKVSVSLDLREGIVAKPLPPPPPEPKLDPMEEFKRDPLIRKALEIFRAEVQPG